MITQDRLKELLHYDPVTGLFRWKKNKGNEKRGGVVGYSHSSGYTCVHIDGRTYAQHRLAWLDQFGVFPVEIDHVNHKKHDNRIDNLRNCTRQENSKNVSMRKDNTSGVAGIGKQRNKWRARIYVDGKEIHLGLYTDIASARAARKLAEYMYGFHENHGA
jgi:hypothetical protein